MQYYEYKSITSKSGLTKEVAMRESDLDHERTMFEKSFERTTNYFKLSKRQQWEIDDNLGILDWIGTGLNSEDWKRFKDHYNV